MDYDIVTLQNKNVVGITARTRNNDENMGNIIGGLWSDFYGKGIYQSIENKSNDCSIGLYSREAVSRARKFTCAFGERRGVNYPAASGGVVHSNYENDENGEYDITVGCEVSDTKNIPCGTVVKNILQGKYAKFIVEGDMKTAVQEFWAKLWEMPLDRKYSGDFEEYQPENSMEHAVIHIYIAVN